MNPPTYDPCGNQTDYAAQRVGMVMDMLLLALSIETLRAMHADVCRARDAGPWYRYDTQISTGETRITREWREAWEEIVVHIGEIIGRKEEEAKGDDCRDI
jgi:hypothetical protein